MPALFLRVVVFICLSLLVTSVSIDPDAYRNFTQIIQAKGYPCESHDVITEDGYILTMFRIPYGVKNTTQTNRQPIQLQHGFLDSSFTWIVNEPNESLAYILADQGYDVWMGNNRGNVYSSRHVWLDPHQKEFWEFSWDQMALYDFPAQLDYIRNYTGFDKIPYIGHSEGTMVVFAALSLQPQLAQKLTAYAAFGPVATVGHITNFFLKTLADMDVAQIFLLFGEKRFLPSSKLLNELFPEVCHVDPSICDDVIEFLCGKHKGAFNNSRMPVIAAHEPGGSSVQNLVHFAQGIQKDNFAMYDWGSPEANRQHYNGSSTPPVYDLSQFPSATLKTGLWYGTADELADPTDVSYLIGHLPSPPVIARELNNYAHLDYVWDYTAVTTFYSQVLEFISS